MVQSCGSRGVAGCISMAERPKPGSLALSDIHFLVPFNKSLPATVVSVISKEALSKHHRKAYLGSGPKPDKLKLK